MIFIFENTDETLELSLGCLIRGLHKNGNRPIAVTLNHEELAALLSDKHRKYAVCTLLPALRRNQNDYH